MSENSVQVLKNAEALRERTKASVDILYVSDVGLHLDFAVQTRKTFYDEFVASLAMDYRQKMKEQIEQSGIQGEAIFKEGDIAETINTLLTNGKEKYDLLIIGHNSKRGLFQHLLGSTARKLLSSVSVPTLIIKEDLKFNKMGSLVECEGPVDWMITSSLDFYRSLGFKEMEFISLWHENGQRSKEKMEEEVRYFLHGNEKPIILVRPAGEFQVAQELFEIVKEEKIDLAIMKRNRGQKLKKMVLGSETLRMLEMEGINLLILPV
ncbi:MAG: universal stress protein [Bacteriovoracia bacterium]